MRQPAALPPHLPLLVLLGSALLLLEHVLPVVAMRQLPTGARNHWLHRDSGPASSSLPVVLWHGMGDSAAGLGGIATAIREELGEWYSLDAVDGAVRKATCTYLIAQRQRQGRGVPEGLPLGDSP